MTLGPFEMTVQQVETLGLLFTEFVNRLLVVAQRAGGIDGHLLTISHAEAVADGGVDAATRDATVTDWVPAGDTAWQFKRGDLPPAKCVAELRGATWAHQFLRDGGSYVLVLGKGLTDRQIETRRQALVAVAIELHLVDSDVPKRVRVYDANKLARWASLYPSLVVSRLANGPGTAAIDFTSWSSRHAHQGVWTPDPTRETAASSLCARLAAPGLLDIRLQGDSGIGKTRLALEALRSEEFSPLVAYVDEPTALSGELLGHLLDDRRTAILVVDECPADRHAKLTDKLPAGTTIKLVTIGEKGPAITSTPIIALEPMPVDRIEEFLRANSPSLGAEARRFVAVHSRGNMRWAMVLAERVREGSSADAADLIRRDDITTFIATVLPEGRDFFCAAVLALLNRVGWDAGLRYQLQTLAEFARRPIEDLESVGEDLERRGLLVRHGRLRAVEPHPLAVFLAAEVWRTDGHRIVDELLPKLDEGMALALFQRVADLGRSEAVRSALPALLSGAGPFASLSRIEEMGFGRLLTQLAIVLPDELTMHLSEQIEAQSLNALREERNLRRDLVWTLEKLAWHRRTFEHAANGLLRLALAETEAYSNNATGTWVGLFGTMLPGTAAQPPERAAYLRLISKHADPMARQLAIKAAQQALAIREVITVSAELQGGVLVEPRGTPVTYKEALAYRSSAVDVLDELRADPDADVAQMALEALIALLYTLFDDSLAGTRFIDILATLEGRGRIRVRAEVEKLLRLCERHEPDQAAAAERLEALLQRLPPADALERIQVLAGLQRWDDREGQLQGELDGLVATLAPSEVVAVVDLLDSDIPAAWEIGHALAGRPAAESALYVVALVSKLPSNAAALPGFLSGQVESGDEGAFDDFLDNQAAAGLDDRARLFVAVRGPVTPRARARVLSALRRLPISSGTSLLFGWQANLNERDVADLLDDWLGRLSSQHDYNSLVDWLSLWLHGQPTSPDTLRPRVLRLLLLRKEYPGLTQQRWPWARLADGFLDSHPLELAATILDSVDAGVVMLHEGDEDSRVLVAAATRKPEDVWSDVARRLQRGSWRVQMEVRGWLLAAIPVEVLEVWIEDDVRKARIVAGIAPVGGDSPSPVARYLLEKFGEDEKVASLLSTNFAAGFWMGPESTHLAQQIDQLNAWRRRQTESLAVRAWAAKTVSYLEQYRAAAEQREAEEPF
jgi:hypothetical protein